MSKTPHEALSEAIEAGRTRRFVLSGHALDRCEQRAASPKDVREALRTATRATREDNSSRWLILGGVDLDGEPLAVVVAFGPLVEVVTVFDK